MASDILHALQLERINLLTQSRQAVVTSVAATTHPITSFLTDSFVTAEQCKKSQIFTQLAMDSQSGLHFLRPTRGMLPNGVPAFDTLSPSPISNLAGAGISSYQYAIGLQGLTSQIKCKYALSSPISFAIPYDGLFQAIGVCPPSQEVLPSQTRSFSTLSNHTGILAMWSRRSRSRWSL